MILLLLTIVCFLQEFVKNNGPFKESEEDKENEAEELLQLRNMAAGSFFGLNMIFVLLVFLLQTHVDKVSIPWLLDGNLRLEPIGLLFLVIFGVILTIQTLGMLKHRVSTFIHYIADTRFTDHKPDSRPRTPSRTTTTAEDCSTDVERNVPGQTRTANSLNRSETLDNNKQGEVVESGPVRESNSAPQTESGSLSSRTNEEERTNPLTQDRTRSMDKIIHSNTGETLDQRFSINLGYRDEFET